MYISFFLAKVIGLYLIITCGAMLVRRKRLMVIVEQFIENSAMTLLSGIMSLILGLLMVVSHNVWVFNWRILITLIGWLTLIKGIAWLYFPSAMRQYAERMVENKTYMATLVVSLVIGFFLFTMGCIG